MPLDTPMMRQYTAMKDKHPDCLLFFRLGDFYEMFGDDAVLVSRELDLTLTTRDRTVENPDERVPMCGVPHHSSEAYIARLVAKGYKIAICEQLEDPSAAKGLVERDIIRVVTAGTLTEPSMLDDGKPNYLAAIYISDDELALARADISTGEATAFSYPANAPARLRNELAAAPPRETLLGGAAATDKTLARYIADVLGCTADPRDDLFDGDISALGDSPIRGAAALAAAALVKYIAETRLSSVPQLRFHDTSDGEYMELDIAAIRGLELVQSSSTGEKRGSLLWAVDHTRTPMGRRMLRAWVLRPLLGVARIQRRLDAVGELVSQSVARGEITYALRGIGDVERLSGKIAYGNGNARDVAALGQSLDKLDDLLPPLEPMKSAELREIFALDRLADLRADIARTIDAAPPVALHDGGLIKLGCDPEVDRLRELVNGGGDAVAQLEMRERDRTGLRLKVGYNRVTGYYIELPRSKAEDVPPDYVRRQTLANTERYVTEELKRLENDVLSARERCAQMEFEIFTALCKRVAAAALRVSETAERIAVLDALCSLAETASRGGWVMPALNVDGVIDITAGRHPVVELTHTDSHFVPNDAKLDCRDRIATIITGPNMAGKSTYMRQTALIVLLAQIGSFVPASAANISVVDRIFTRIGAADDLAGGRSTFMVEMSEASDILAHATRRSLILLDEIGRGTSTYDGMAIARAILEFCADRRRLGAKTMFSTHYHELADMEHEIPGVVCCAMTARRQGGEVIFLRKVTPGAMRDSYGIDVARLAGLPESVLRRARTVMDELSGGAQPVATTAPVAAVTDQFTLSDTRDKAVVDRLHALEPDALSPIEALNLIYELKKELGD
ncbi:MAG: DNA mismatch repair protein MutS [Oscillospiraceae bacterium]|jgi:DNA mismatch repair protein MutS|nr:DNA mismatch repair protein MutS [Oscillospiraceae bacterium]